MSTKDTIKAVQAVLDTFGPLVTALPVALDTLVNQDKAERRVKQLEDDANKLVDRFNAQVALWETAEVEHKTRLDAQAREVADQLAKARSDLKDVQAKQRQVTKLLADKDRELLTAQTTMQEKLDAARRQFDAEVAQARQQADEQIASIREAVDVAEKKHAAVVKKLEDLKAKL